MATIATQVVSEAGGALTQTNCNAGGDKVSPSDDLVVEFDNRHASADYVVTLDEPTTPTPVGATAFNADVSFTVVHATKRYVKVPARFRNPSDGLAAFTYGATPTTMTICAYTA